jgi:hypothetical protein
MRILFVCANRGQLGNALPVARALAAGGDRAHLLAADALHGQGVGAALELEPLPDGVTWSQARLPRLDPPFAQRSLPGRLRCVRRLAPRLAGLTRTYDAVVVGMDGAFERVLLREARRRGLVTALILDGSLLAPPRLRTGPGAAWSARRWLRFHVRRTLLRLTCVLGLEPYAPGLLAHTPLERIYTMGAFTTRTVEAHRLGAAVETTGIPRLAQLAGEASDLEPEPNRVLYASSAFLWHDEAWLDRCQQRNLESLAAALPEAGWELHVRLHPREDPERFRALAGRTGVFVSPASRPLLGEIAAARAVVTSVSTAAIEALGAGRPVWIHLDGFPADHSEYVLGACLPVTRSAAALVAELAKLRDGNEPRPGLPEEICSPETPRAGERIAASLCEAVAARRS